MSHPIQRVAAGALSIAFALALGPMRPAVAQVHRCTTADGGTLYSDRPCAVFGASENTAPPPGGGATGTRYRGGCSRRLQDLVFEVTTAIESGDVNRLAASYHWPGHSTRGGNATIDRLDAITRRPLLNITALRPADTVVVADPATMAHAGTGPAASGWSLSGTAADAARIAAEHATLRAPQRPVALRIDQVLSDGITPSRTTFGLRRHMDCWWVTL
ncbi:DUF4124 domain-containing protein [Luteimonas sp. MC1782]|uniref:DUF4124 domain-containing protein n=1 Tax=Luteimonas sp. MC1782 TaxID=2760305 RepID=UPI0016006347|nr:DUF4124 domain-containing protein [Luteimonas sp. MC1782]MBB1472807.1 DUF4124 domain-containing protein [Luteimonas sp. MC1782]